MSLAATQINRGYDLMKDFGSRALFTDNSTFTASNWLDENRTGFTCLFLSSSHVQQCGLNIQVGDGWRKGMNIDHYQSIKLAIEYQGPAEKFRVSFRNGSEQEDGTLLPKFHQLYLPIRRGTFIYDIPLDNLEVANWWLVQYGLTDEASKKPERKNLIHMGFEIENPMPVGQHYFKVLEFSILVPFLSVGSLPRWLLISTVYLLVVGLIYNYFRLHSVLKERSEEMFGLLQQLEKADTESAHFKKLSMYDPLTTLLNRRAALELIEEYSRHKSLSDTALIFMDIDHFKQVNDTYGHDLGDEVLKTVSVSVRQLLREEDAAVRWGGEEIVLICPKTSVEGAMRIAEKLRVQVKELRFSHPDVQISASFGVDTIRSGETLDKAFKRADNALYQAKNQGRDQICQYNAESSNVGAKDF